MFERPTTFRHGYGTSIAGRVDCYKRGHFVWESKKLKAGIAAQQTDATTKALDDALLRARQQAEDYVRAFPASQSRPPFVGSSTLATSSSSTPNSPAAAPPTRRSPIRAATASASIS